MTPAPERSGGPQPETVDPLHYWAIDVPGLQRTHAEALLAWIRSQPWGGLAYAVNPVIALTLHMDEGTVRKLLAATVLAADSVEETGDSNLNGFRSLAEEFQGWLEGRLSDVHETKKPDSARRD